MAPAPMMLLVKLNVAPNTEEPEDDDDEESFLRELSKEDCSGSSGCDDDFKGP